MTVHTGGAPLSIVDGVRVFAAAMPGAPAVVDGDKVLTYAQLDDRSSRLAQTLLAAGLTTGDRVALLLGNRLEYCEAAAGIAKAGLVMVALNPRMTTPEADYVLEHSGSRALVLDDALAAVAGGAGAGMPTVLSIDGDSPRPVVRGGPGGGRLPGPARRRVRARPVLRRVHLRHHRPAQGRRHLAPVALADVPGQRARVGSGHRAALDRRRAALPRRRLRVRLRAGLHRRHRLHAARPGTPRPCWR